MHPVLVVVFTLNRSFYPTTSAVPHCPSWFFILERYKLCGHRQWDREKPNVAKESRQANCTRYIRCTYLACIPVYHSGANYSDYGVMRIIQVPFLVWFDTTEINNVTKVIYFSWYHVSRKCLRLYTGTRKQNPRVFVRFSIIPISGFFSKKKRSFFPIFFFNQHNQQNSPSVDRALRIQWAIYTFKVCTQLALPKKDWWTRQGRRWSLFFSFAFFIGSLDREKLSIPV